MDTENTTEETGASAADTPATTSQSDVQTNEPSSSMQDDESDVTETQGEPVAALQAGPPDLPIEDNNSEGNEDPDNIEANQDVYEDAQMEMEEGNELQEDEADDENAVVDENSSEDESEEEEQQEENVEEGNLAVDANRQGHRMMRGWLRYLRLPRLPRAILRRLRGHQYAEVFENLRFRGADDDLDRSDEEDAQEIQRPRNITFDQSLPTSHSYLGELDDCSGVQYMDQESFIVLPILRIPDLILVPGQTFPLNMAHPQEIALMKHVVSREDKTFGVILSVNRYDSTTSVVDMGCTAELRSIRQEEVYEVPTMVGLAIGRQRFKIMEERPQPDGNLFAKVQILGDDELSPPASGARLAIHSKLHLPPVDTGKGPSKLRRSPEAKAAWLSAAPPWAYNMYDVRTLRTLLIQELKEWNQDLNEKLLPVSPAAFSFWVAAHLCITNPMRLYLLKIDTAIQRLRCELDLIKKCTVYACSDCGNLITEKQDVFSMSLSGPMAAYVNPSGHIHETLTVYKSRGLSHVSRPSTEHSWFPGYAWTICECSHCGRHMGWKFTATKSELTPKKFWGLTRSGLSPKVMTDPEVDNFEAPAQESTQRRRGTSESSSISSASSSQNLVWRPML